VFVFSLPLVPHSLAAWILELSDRAILERYVSLKDLGLYSLGYQFGSVILLLATAINFAWTPFFFKTVEREGKDANQRLAQLTTYYTMFLCFVALAIGLFIKEIIQLMAAPAFHPAYQVAYWIIGGQLLAGLYFIPANFLFFKRATRVIPVVTISAGFANLGINLLLVPHYGIIAAAWSTFLSYGLMLALVWFFASRVYPFPYEYRRLVRIVLAAAGLFALGTVLPYSSGITKALVRGSLISVFPITLMVLGVFTPAEKLTLLSMIQHGWAMARKTLKRV
jgi:O-antigen/teichoic acid export membrane protein